MNEQEIIKSLEIFSHKLKNPIHAVGLNIDVAKAIINKKLPNDKDIVKHLSIVANETQRISEIIEKYTNYLKLKDKERQKINLNKMLSI